MNKNSGSIQCTQNSDANFDKIRTRSLYTPPAKFKLRANMQFLMYYLDFLKFKLRFLCIKLRKFKKNYIDH